MKEPKFPQHSGENAPSPSEFHLTYESKPWNDREPYFNWAEARTITGCEPETKVLISERTKHWDDDSPNCWDCEDDEGGCEECDFGKMYQNDDPISGKSLQDIIDMLPEGVEPKDVIIDFGMDDFGGRLVADLDFQYEAKVDFETQNRLYQDALAIWTVKFDQFVEAHKKWVEWKRDTDIADMQTRLKELEEQRSVSTS